MKILIQKVPSIWTWSEMLGVKAGNIASGRGVTAPSLTSTREMIRSSMTRTLRSSGFLRQLLLSTEHLKRYRYALLSVPWTEERGKGANFKKDVTR
jgi:hypothetical protein